MRYRVSRSAGHTATVAQIILISIVLLIAGLASAQTVARSPWRLHPGEPGQEGVVPLQADGSTLCFAPGTAGHLEGAVVPDFDAAQWRWAFDQQEHEPLTYAPDPLPPVDCVARGCDTGDLCAADFTYFYTDLFVEDLDVDGYRFSLDLQGPVHHSLRVLVNNRHVGDFVGPAGQSVPLPSALLDGNDVANRVVVIHSDDGQGTSALGGAEIRVTGVDADGRGPTPDPLEIGVRGVCALNERPTVICPENGTIAVEAGDDCEWHTDDLPAVEVKSAIEGGSVVSYIDKENNGVVCRARRSLTSGYTAADGYGVFGGGGTGRAELAWVSCWDACGVAMVVSGKKHHPDSCAAWIAPVDGTPPKVTAIREEIDLCLGPLTVDPLHKVKSDFGILVDDNCGAVAGIAHVVSSDPSEDVNHLDRAVHPISGHPYIDRGGSSAVHATHLNFGWFAMVMNRDTTGKLGNLPAHARDYTVHYTALDHAYNYTTIELTYRLDTCDP